jgi:hypothetical protein
VSAVPTAPRETSNVATTAGTTGPTTTWVNRTPKYEPTKTERSVCRSVQPDRALPMALTAQYIY